MAASEIWSKIGVSSGLLTDRDITILGEKGLLISKEFDSSQVRQTCYELRVGKVAYLPLRPEAERRKIIDEQNPLIVRPTEVATIITYEEISLPEFILGRIVSKGHLFSLGLSPVITYADPGFSGNLGITFINLSKKSIKFSYKDAICKIEFEKLGTPVAHPYRGPHSFASSMWPIDTNRFLPKRQIGPRDLGNDELLKKDAEYFGEPFDLVSERIICIEDKIRKLVFILAAVASVVVGVGLFLVVQRTFDMFKILPESIQSGIVSGIVAGLFTVLSVILEWRLLRRKM